MMIKNDRVTCNPRKRPHPARITGQGIVEFALVLPILLVVMFGILEFGRLMFIYTVSAAASREGARYAAAVGMNSGTPLYGDCAGISAAAARIGAFAGVDPGDVSITYEDLFNSSTTAPVPSYSCTDPWPSHMVATLGSRVIVQVQIDYEPLLLGFNVPAIANRTFITRRTLVTGVSIEPG